MWETGNIGVLAWKGVHRTTEKMGPGNTIRTIVWLCSGDRFISGSINGMLLTWDVGKKEIIAKASDDLILHGCVFFDVSYVHRMNAIAVCSVTKVASSSSSLEARDDDGDDGALGIEIVLYDAWNATKPFWKTEIPCDQGSTSLSAQFSHTGSGAMYIFETSRTFKILLLEEVFDAVVKDSRPSSLLYAPMEGRMIVSSCQHASRKLLGCGTLDGSVCLWSKCHGNIIALAENVFGQSVSCVRFSRCGDLLAAGTILGNVCIFDTIHMQCTHRCLGHLQGIIAFAFLPRASSTQCVDVDRKECDEDYFLASVSADHTLMIWRVMDGTCVM